MKSAFPHATSGGSAPCGRNVNARDTANLTGLVRDEAIDQGSCRQFLSNFAIFPTRGLAQVLFHRGPKRIGFTETEHRIAFFSLLRPCGPTGRSGMPLALPQGR